jgi:basic amino acid/polyamine antiporter, APA family
MAFVRSIGRWTLTALFINCTIGGSVFALPGELNRLLGRASPLAMVFAAVAVGIIMGCIAEVASQFTGPGGAYLYTRTAFGRFVGLQTAWFGLLAPLGAVAVCANLFLTYLMTFVPWTLNVWEHGLAIALLIAIPAALNYRGVRSGANFSTVMTIAKLLPLALLIVVGITRFAHQLQMIHASEISSPGPSNWVRAVALLFFTFSGGEDSLIPTGEIREPRRTIPLAVGTGLIGCAAIYMLLQFVIVATVGPNATGARSVFDAASLLFGARGAALMSIGIMVSTYGFISGVMLNIPRLVYSLAAEGDLPSNFARIHPRFHTPAVAIVVCAFAGWILAVSGTFLFVLAISAGATMVYYSGICASLLRLRKLHPHANAFRIPFGPVLSVVAVAISVGMMIGLKPRELLLMCVTSLIATANWLWARRHFNTETKAESAAAAVSLP